MTGPAQKKDDRDDRDNQEVHEPGPHSSFVDIHDDDAAHPEVRGTADIVQLIQQMHETVDKFLRDRASRGDVKIVNTALKELRYCFKVFAPLRDRRKVTVFGSARLPAAHPAYQAAVEFGRKMAQSGYMVITGAAAGIMEAGHVGAGPDNSIGVNIMLPFEQHANAVIASTTRLMTLRYFFTRKLLFIKEADAIALFAGGFGTQDEGFEALTLVQTGKSHLFPIVMVDEAGGDYWKLWEDYVRKAILKRGLISPADMSLFKVVEGVEPAVREILGFYRVYHSMRYVDGDLVLRLQKQLPEEGVEKLRKEFADIVVAGTIEQTNALPAEANEPKLARLPRLRFRFDRRQLGRLRQMVDLINVLA
jgi:uncharacterized protein (TIGR00730 family)